MKIGFTELILVAIVAFEMCIRDSYIIEQNIELVGRVVAPDKLCIGIAGVFLEVVKDVYKRQVPFLLDFLKDVGFMPLALPPSGTGQDTQTAPARQYSLASVSYTHLDVYKRQPCHRCCGRVILQDPARVFKLSLIHI